MKYLLLALLLVACNCAGADLHSSKNLGLLYGMSDSTVALVKKRDSGAWGIGCTAVWIAADVLLTAAHCVDDDAPPHYLTWGDALAEAKGARDAKVERIEPLLDLALLRVENPPFHSIAVVSSEDPMQGDSVHVLGHTMGYPWSYTPGVVGAVRVTENTHDYKVHAIQVVCGASYGNSGGGLFNERGELIGIASFLLSDTTLVFFVHRDEIVTFLAR